MIRIIVESDPSGIQYRLEISGHAGKDMKGKDILCAAVSVLGQTFIMAAARLEDTDQSVTQNDGYLQSKLDLEKASGESRISLKNYLDFLIYGIIELEKQYPEDINLFVRYPDSADKGESNGT